MYIFAYSDFSWIKTNEAKKEQKKKKGKQKLVWN